MARLAALVFAVALSVPAFAAEPETVRVTWASPATFTDFGDRRNPDERTVEAYADNLGDHLIGRARRALAPGDRLQVTIQDVDMAGAFEPVLRSSWNDVRIMKEIYPPRIDLAFTLLRADGKRLEGTRRLTDRNYLTGPAGRFGNDPLRYEKALLDDWVTRELRGR